MVSDERFTYRRGEKTKAEPMPVERPAPVTRRKPVVSGDMPSDEE